MTSIQKPPVLVVPAVQFIVLGVASLALSLAEELDPLSFLLGGLVAIIPQVYFSVYAFKYMGARAAKDIARSFYKGEFGKYILTLIGFGLVFLLYPKSDLIALFGSYVFMLMLQNWLTVKLLKRQA